MRFSEIKNYLLILASALAIGTSTSFAEEKRPKSLSKPRVVAVKYGSPTHTVDILTKWGDIMSSSLNVKKKLYRDPSLNTTVDIELEGKVSSFDLENGKKEKYDLSSVGVTFHGNYRREIDGEYGWILPYVTVEPKLGLSYLDLSVEKESIKKQEEFFLGNFGITGNLFFEKDAALMFLRKKGSLNPDDYMDVLNYRNRNKKPSRFINLGLGLEKIVNFSAESIDNDNVTYFKDIDNEPLTVKTHINIDDVYRLSYAHSFGKHQDNNEIWVDYFKRIRIPAKDDGEYRTHNRFTIGYNNDYGSRDIFYIDSETKFLRCEIDYYSDINDRRNRYFGEVNARVDSTGGGKLIFKVPLPDYMMKRLLFGKELGFLRDDCSVDRNQELSITTGFERKTYDDADAHNSAIFGIGWDYVRRPKE